MSDDYCSWAWHEDHLIPEKRLAFAHIIVPVSSFLLFFCFYISEIAPEVCLWFPHIFASPVRRVHMVVFHSSTPDCSPQGDLVFSGSFVTFLQGDFDFIVGNQLLTTFCSWVPFFHDSALYGKLKDLWGMSTRAVAPESLIHFSTIRKAIQRIWQCIHLASQP